MEASNVLKEYLDLFTADCRQIKLLVAPNAVVDWFGRTIRGPAKIHDYLRFEIAAHYDHENFEKAEECDPIEQRPSHWKTKSLPADDVDLVLPLNRIGSMVPLKNYADSDLDDDDLDIQPLPAGNQTPEHQTSNTLVPVSELTPPSSAVKPPEGKGADSQTDSGDDEQSGETAPKRLKRTLPKPFSYLRRLPTANSRTKHLAKSQLTPTHFDMHVLGEDTSSDEELDADYQKKLAEEYTPLRYIEATGKLRGKSQLIHSTDTPPSPHSTRGWDRLVRLRISYRRNLTDQQLQIALVIYEHVNSARTEDDGTVEPSLRIRRRNLMAQFNEAAQSEQLTDDTPVHDVDHHSEVVVAGGTDIGTTSVPLAADIVEDDAESTNVIEVPLRTPTKSMQTPPATPKRKRRIPYAMSGMKRIHATPSTSTTPKRSAARTLRL